MIEFKEYSVESGQRTEARQFADVRQCVVGCKKKFCCMGHSELIDKIDEGGLKRVVDVRRDVSSVRTEFRCHVVNGETLVLVNLFLDEQFIQ